jgi:16S rRNA (guanine966-N2)-methyltransferase
LKSTQTAMLRPTTDRVRESIFNILAARFEFEDASALDLFAGTGALGIEALSRGAATCEFVESDRRAASVIGDNLRTLGLESRGRVSTRDAMKFIAGPGGPYDLIFADPPYAATIFERLVADIFANGILAPEGIFVLEHAGTMTGPAAAGAELILSRGFGDTGISIYGVHQGDAQGEIASR